MDRSRVTRANLAMALFGNGATAKRTLFDIDLAHPFLLPHRFHLGPNLIGEFHRARNRIQKQ